MLKVLDLLHAGNVNIANLNVVRARQLETHHQQQQGTGEEQQHAVTLMSLDNDIPSKIMNQIKNLSNLEDIAKIRLV